MGSGVKRLRDQVEKFPLDSALKAEVLKGVDATDDRRAAELAEQLEQMFRRLPQKLERIREALAADEAESRVAGEAAQPPPPKQRTDAVEDTQSEATYEVLVIVSSHSSALETLSLITNFRSLAAASGAVVRRYDFWGRRRFSYPVDGEVEGDYHRFVLVGTARSQLSKLNRMLKDRECVLRHLIITVEDLRERSAQNPPPLMTRVAIRSRTQSDADEFFNDFGPIFEAEDGSESSDDDPTERGDSHLPH